MNPELLAKIDSVRRMLNDEAVKVLDLDIKFSTGKVVNTAGVDLWVREPMEGEATLEGVAEWSNRLAHCVECLNRHATGDWGDVHPEDSGLNDQALEDGTRLLSVYKDDTYPTLWIITEADRSVTTMLFPNEY